MNKTLRWWLIGLWALQACSPTQPNSKGKQDDQAVIMTLADRPIFKDEFIYLYQKNYKDSDSAFSEQSVRDYLDLFTKFKLKIAEAESRGMHEEESFQDEFEGYRKQLARPYLTDQNVTDELVKEAYDRLKTEVKASHILIKLEANATPADTLSAWNKINRIYDQLSKEQVSFEEAARAHSQDGTAKNGGMLGWFTSMQMIYPFEDVAYTTPKGEFSKPFRTRFGYHIVRVHDRRDSRGEVKVAHIMVRATEGISKEDSLAAAARIMGIKQKIEQGGNWDELCSEFSDDARTRQQGGQLQWIKPGSGAPAAFEDAAFQLPNVGDIIGPVKTPYGFHLIKLLDKRQLASFEEMEGEIRRRIARDSRADISRTLFVEKLKKSNRFKDDYPGKEQLATRLARIDSSILQARWVPDTSNAEQMAQRVFTINGEPYSVKDALLFIQQYQRQQAKRSPAAYAGQLYDKFVETALIKYEEAHLADKYPEYRHLVKEYRDGILLFKIMEEEVWGKASRDTTGLKNYYETHQDQYRWGERVNALVISVNQAKWLDSVRLELEKDLWRVYSVPGRNLTFPTNKTILEPQTRTAIDQMAYQLRRHPDYRLQITCRLRQGETQDMANARYERIMTYLKEVRVMPDQLIFEPQTERNVDSEAAQVNLMLFSVSPKALETKYNRQDALRLKIHDGWFEKSNLAEVDAVPWTKGEHKLEKGGRHVLVIIRETADPQRKAFDETRGQVISDYQNQLEADWIRSLEEKYPVKYRENVVKSIIK